MAVTRAWGGWDDWPMTPRCPDCHRNDHCGRDPDNLTVGECATWDGLRRIGRRDRAWWSIHGLRPAPVQDVSAMNGLTRVEVALERKRALSGLP